MVHQYNSTAYSALIDERLRAAVEQAAVEREHSSPVVEQAAAAAVEREHTTAPVVEQAAVESTQALSTRMGIAAARYAKALDGFIKWSMLIPGSKKPLYKWSQPEHRYDEKPRWHRGNFMAIPVNGLVVFDIDVNKEDFIKAVDPAYEMLGILAENLEIPLRDMFYVRTPSGGIHAYVIWGDSRVPRPNSHVLSRIDERIEGDVRSSASNSYVVAPGSWISMETMKTRLPEDVTWGGMNNDRAYYFVESRVDRVPRLPQGLSSKLYKAIEGDRTVHPRTKERKNTNTSTRGNKYSLKKRIENNESFNKLERFHEKRAFIYKAISCHYSDEEIIALWDELRVDFDTNDGEIQPLSPVEIVNDAAGLVPSSTCSHICAADYKPPVRRENNENSSDEEPATPEEYIERARERERAPQVWRTYGVVDILKAAESIMKSGKRSSPSRSQRLAFQIVANEVSFHTSMGRLNILLGIEYISKQYRVKSSAAKAALKLLREVGIIYIHRKQSKGALPLYRVNEPFIQGKLTRCLLRTIGENSVDISPWNFHRTNVDFETGMLTVLDIETGSMLSFEVDLLKNMGEQLKEKYEDFYTLLPDSFLEKE